MEDSIASRGGPVGSNPSDIIVKPHSDTATYYRYRIPYSQSFFQGLVRKLPISPGSRLLDLCCGSGQLAAGFAESAGHIVAVDGAEGMIALAAPHPKVTYLCHDINSGEKSPGVYSQTYDHILIGRAIPYVSTPTLNNLVINSLKPDGAIVVCGAGLDPQIPWVADFKRLRESFANIRGDFYGTAKLAHLGFHVTDSLLVRTSIACNPRFLIAHALSYALTHQRINDNMERFKAVLSRQLAPHIKNGKLQGEVLSWALIYKHSPHQGSHDDRQHQKLPKIPLPL